MIEAGTIRFQDIETRDEAVVIVRYDQSQVALCLSIKSDGDLEVSMTKDDTRALLEVLKRAIS